MKAKQIMTIDLVAVTEKSTLREVIQLMLENNISGIPVVDNDGKLKGIVSESDVIRLKRKLHMPDYIQLLESLINNAYPEDFNAAVTRALKMPVAEFMTKQVITVNENTSLFEITHLMLEHGINRILVVRDSRLAGIVTRRDIIRAMAAINKDIH